MASRFVVAFYADFPSSPQKKKKKKEEEEEREKFEGVMTPALTKQFSRHTKKPLKKWMGAQIVPISPSPNN